MLRTPKIKRGPVKLLVNALIVASIFTGIEFFKLADYMTYGVWIIASWISPPLGASQNGNILLTPAFQSLAFLAPAIIVGFILAIFRQKAAFRTGFISTLVAYFITKIVTAFLLSPWINGLIAPLLAMIASYILASLLVRRVSKTIFVWLIVIALALINQFAIPVITRGISKPITDARQADELSRATKDMQFTAYYPSYIPQDLTATKPKLEGYHNSAYQHQHVSYNVGKLEFMVSEKLKNQDSVFNRTDNCDIGAIWFAMRSKAEISQAIIDRSRDNLAICQLLGKTDDGHEVYIRASRSQFKFYYMAVGDSIIVMQYDTLPKPQYANDFDKEVFKIFNGMKKLDATKLTAGY